MKKLLLTIFVAAAVVNGFSQKKSFSRWSFVPEYGYNFFDGDINQNLVNVLPTSIMDVTYGGNWEYALSPIWGLGLDTYYFPLKAKNQSPKSVYINTHLYTGSLNFTVNFTRLIFPHANYKWIFNASVGLGMAYYTYDVRNMDNTPVLATDTYDDIKYGGVSRPLLLPMKYGVAATCPVTFSMEYNLSRPLAIGAKMHYRAFTKDNLEGLTYLTWDGVTNDFVAAGTVFLRYKFNSIKKQHLRNISIDTFDPDKGWLLAKELEGKLNKLKDKVDTIGAKVDSLMPRVARLENLLSNDGPDSDGDGVPDVRDRETNTPVNTTVDFWGKALAVNPGYTPETGKARVVNATDDVPAVYFDFDQIDLDDAALITISKIASKMKADSTLYVEVRGYCDYAGSNPYNNLLSQRRSDRVKAELVKVWGIPFDHIISNGKGKVIEPRSKYRPNRRCDFFFGRL